MSVTRLRISTEGNIIGLWDDGIDWHSLGNLTIHRASHVEFCARRQLWYAQRAQSRNALHRFLQCMLNRPFGEVLHWSPTRQEALEWERAYFTTQVIECPRTSRHHITGKRVMSILEAIFTLFAWPLGRHPNVRDHAKNQAFGPRWSRHRRRHIRG